MQRLAGPSRKPKTQPRTDPSTGTRSQQLNRTNLAMLAPIRAHTLSTDSLQRMFRFSCLFGKHMDYGHSQLTTAESSEDLVGSTPRDTILTRKSTVPWPRNYECLVRIKVNWPGSTCFRYCSQIGSI